MITSKNNIANAMSGKTARACDSCIRKRARWYCAADDAFLCQACDRTVHSANPLARRHERVRLKTASLNRADHDLVRLPSWSRGSTRKARTPRHGKNHSSKSGHNMEPNPVRVVPELGVEETTSFSSSHGEDDDQLLYQVPIYDPFVGELCSSSTTTRTVEVEGSLDHHHFLIKSPTQDGYLGSDLDFEEFAADVETLLGKGLGEESYGIEELGLLACSPNHNHTHNNENEYDVIMNFGKVAKDEEMEQLDGGELVKKCEIEVESSDDVGIRVPFELTFHYDHDFPTSTCHDHIMVDGKGNDREMCKLEGDDCTYDDDDDEKLVNEEVVVINNKRRKILLRLDYEAISTAWASQGSPWVNGHRPEISPQDCWPHSGTSGTGMHQSLFGDIQLGGIGGNNGGGGDGGREARVSRYREKRRTRLFSKKIRYEVRKLNAEKRPRMKGRFVKRSSFAPTTSAFPLLSKK